MNAKKCKALRKVLKNLQNAQPDMLKGDCTYVEDKTKRKIITIQDFDEKGELIAKQIPISAGTITVNSQCKHGLYKKFKKNLAEQESSHG
jgi:hypothetical protein